MCGRIVNNLDFSVFMERRIAMLSKKNVVRRRGLVTVETALVLGFLILLIIGGLDIAFQFHVRHCLTAAVREAVRHLAVRGGTEEEARTAAMNQLAGINANFTVSYEISNQDVTVRVSVLQEEISLGIFPYAEGATIVTQSTMRNEI